jgi:hypothetical protein
MRRIEDVLALCAGVLVLLGAVVWVQRSAASQPPQESSPAKRTNSEKPKKWQGKLVDANCMVKALNAVAAHAPHSAGQGFPHFAGSSSQQGQYPGGGTQQQTPGSQSEPYPNEPQPNGPAEPPAGSPGVGPDETAQLQRAALVDDAAKKCAATKSTSDFGLALSSGQVIKFGESGNTKASQAIKVAELKPGKAVKATVKASEQSGGSLQVTSVEIKGKHKK